MTSEQREQQAKLELKVAALAAELSVVIVTYRNMSEIADCLRAVERAVSPVPMEVIVVDNASGDGTAAEGRAPLCRVHG